MLEWRDAPSCLHVAGLEPRDLSPTRVPVVMLASDIVGFTLVTEGCPLTEVAPLTA